MTTLRTFTNRPGITYDEAKTSVIFAEDMNNIGEFMATRKTEFKDMGVFLEFDGLEFAMASGGNRALKIKTTTGTRTLNFCSQSMKTGIDTLCLIRTAVSVTTTEQYIDSGLALTALANMQIVHIVEPSTEKIYRVTLIVGALHNDNMISVELL
jgi:hypothetical protein